MNLPTPPADPLDPQALAGYQAAFRDLEARMAQSGAPDHRHRILILVPVADRPRQLADCLESLYRLCDLYRYGGLRDGRFPKVACLIADDSADPASRAAHRALARAFDARGIDSEYYGPKEQLALLERLGIDASARFQSLLGDAPRTAFHHKGQGAMRNLIALRLREILADQRGPLLFWALDSDQEFQVKVQSPTGDRDLYALPYLHELDRLFRETDALIATGKVVGDPPVSPAVMTAGFLDDLIAFLAEASAADPTGPCPYHGGPLGEHDGARYHDMAGRFGFTPQAAYPYRCPLEGPHRRADAFRRLAGQLRAFFYGEHPTRKTYYDPAAPRVAPARTIYTGNYAFRPAALRFFLPFAGLRLRMSGPTLGRMLRAEIGGRFVAVNLPMLHRRTQGDSGVSEFRPGIDERPGAIDLAGEFERQFFGDVMLFCVQRLAEQGFPQQEMDPRQVEAALGPTLADLLQDYNHRGEAIREKLGNLRALLEAPRAYWHSSTADAEAVAALRAFAADIEHNFGPAAGGYARINDPAHQAARQAQLAAAILGYPADRASWEGLLGQETHFSPQINANKHT